MFDKNQLASLMKKAQQVQEDMAKAQEEIARMEVKGQSGAGLVEITLTGNYDAKNVTIEQSAMEDKDMLEDLIAAAINDANRKIEEKKSAKMSEVTAGMPLGGMDGFKLPI